MTKLRLPLALPVALTLAVSAFATETTTYTYDAFGRLVATVSTGSVNNGVSTTYSFDAADNRIQVVVSGVASSSPTFSIAGASGAPGQSLTFNVTKSGTMSAVTTVVFSTADGTATNGTDYIGNSGTLTFAAADTTKPIVVQSLASSVGNRSFSVQLSSAGGGATIAVGSAAGTITANTTAFAVGSASGAPGQTLTFTVSKSGTTTVATSVYYSTANGSAVNGTDYTATSGTLSFAPGDTSKSFSVNTLASSAGANAFSVVLSSPTGGASISGGTGTGTITAAPPPEITANNPPINLNSSTSQTVYLATLVTTHGHNSTIVSMSPASGQGSAAVNSGGQSATYTAPSEPATDYCNVGQMVYTFAVPYSVLDTDTGVTVSGSLTANVTGPTTPPRTCQ